MASNQDILFVSAQRASEIFLLDCESRRFTAQTMAYYRRRLKQFIAWLTEQGISTLAEITPSHLRMFFVQMQQRGLAQDTQVTSARVLRSWLNFCVREELLVTSPMKKVRMPTPSEEILPAYTENDIRLLLAATEDGRDAMRNRAIILCLLDSGVRAAEFCALNVGDVNLADGQVTVWQGKGKKDRYVFIGAKARKALAKYLLARPDAQPNEPLWLAEGAGERLTYWGLSLLVRRLGARAHVKPATLHRFRRTFCLWSLLDGMDMLTISKLMGHKNILMVQRYAAQLTKDLQAAHRAHSPVDRLSRK